MTQKGPQISGMGVVSCLGKGVNSLWQGALEERTGISNGVGMIEPEVLDQLKSTYPQAAKASKAVLLAYAAISEAMQKAEWESLNEDDGFIIATTTGQIPVWESEATRFLRGEISQLELSPSLRSQSLGSLINELSNLLNFRGRSFIVTSACAASTQAIALAALWLAQGKVKRCLVGGSEVLCNLTVEGFRCMQLLTPELASPFDANRKGINLSEGSAFLCLEPTQKAVAAPLAYVSGYGLSTDGYHMTAPHPEGRGIFEAMQNALQVAALSPKDISWVHAHGTGSRHNDQAEGLAIQRLFGETKPWVSSTKRIHGHSLGASGALETALCVQALQKKIILRTSGLKDPDPSISLQHPASHLPFDLRHILKTTLGFGGSNAALVLSPGVN
jgi:3-oxoacyl-(acyl-carrier-protein) synthase